MPRDLPNHAYFRANHGRWRSAFRFVVTDWRAFRGSPMGWLDRMRAVSMAFVPRVLGPLDLETSVDYGTRGEEGEVVHTTRLSKWGIALYDAVETFALDDNGKDVAISREQRFWPAASPIREVGASRGEVEASGTRATYVFPLFGSPMRQIGSIEAAGVRILQETAWSRAEVLLERVREPPE
jgi:hypothetical protein